MSIRTGTPLTPAYHPPMLLGQYTHTVDAKRRVSLPAKFRKSLGREVVITHGLDGSLFLFPKKEWEGMVGKLSELSIGSADSRAMNRFFLSNAMEQGIDSLGRILLPEYLAAYAGIEGTAVIVGISSRIEIWEPKRWESYQRSIEQAVDGMAERLSSIGLL